MDDFLNFILPAKNTLTVANSIYKILDSNTVVKALKEVGQANVRSAFEFLQEEQDKSDLALANLGAAHQCCYTARVKNTSYFKLKKLCEADYYICCLIAFIYFKKGYNEKDIEKYLYYAFCARENAIIYDEKVGFLEVARATFFGLLVDYETTDVVKSSSRKEFLEFCQKIFGKVNCLETEKAGVIYQVKNHSWHQQLLSSQCDIRAALGSRSIRIFCHNITVKVDVCEKTQPMGKFRLLLNYLRIYTPLIINDKWLAIIDSTSFKENIFGMSNKKLTKDGKLKYVLVKGSKKTIELLNNDSLLKNDLATIRKYLKRIEIKEDGLYFWTNSYNPSYVNFEMKEQLPDKVFYTFEQLAMGLI